MLSRALERHCSPANAPTTCFPVIAVIAMDYGSQAVHVTNQSLIYRVQSDAQSRLAAAYMIFAPIALRLNWIWPIGRPMVCSLEL